MTTTPRWLADPFHVPAQRPADHHAADPPSRDLVALRDAFAKVHAEGASANDIAQWLDGYLTERGLDAVLYGETS